MRALCLAALVAAAAAPPRTAAPLRTPAQGASLARAAHGLKDTRCSACHTTASWTRVAFDHTRTGFLLEGRHLEVSCSGCHAGADFKAAVPTSCAGCHRDAHASEFGTRCASCHDERSWQSRFNADAHRRTNFPLTGRHAFLPCEECHVDQRDRGFTRATVQCFTCHQADYARTAATTIDHAAAGFSTNCRDCHNAWNFRGAVFKQHAACFQLAPGPHAGIACLDCHTSLRGATITGACSSGTAACTRCHTCPSVQDVHRQVSGFQCKDRKCYECHSFTALAPRAKPSSGRWGR
jgi:hypothetical protein